MNKKIYRKCKSILQMFVDISMMIIFLLLMEYHLIPDIAHEYLGISLFTLFVLHNALNYRWYLTLFKGKYNSNRILLTFVNFSLLIFMILCVISSMLVSMHVFSSLNMGNSNIGRQLHLVSTIWAFIFMAFHLGLHWYQIIIKLKKVIHLDKKSNLIFAWLFRAVDLALCAYGIYLFISRRMYEEMFF